MADTCPGAVVAVDTVKLCSDGHVKAVVNSVADMETVEAEAEAAP